MHFCNIFAVIVFAFKSKKLSFSVLKLWKVHMGLLQLFFGIFWPFSVDFARYDYSIHDI